VGTLRADNESSPSNPWSLDPMTAVILALVPLLFATGFLTWTMMMGAQQQARSDAWAEAWVKENSPGKKH
jgi:hypothetical protein